MSSAAPTPTRRGMALVAGGQSNVVGKVCPVCSDEIRAGQIVHVVPLEAARRTTLHHGGTCHRLAPKKLGCEWGDWD